VRTRQKNDFENGGFRMTPVQTPFLELQKQLWKARAQAKQKRLEDGLAQPPATADDTPARLAWIKQALETVRLAQAQVRYRTALMDAYTEHLTVLEMTLIAAAEQKRHPDAPPAPGNGTAEQKRSADAATNLSAEAGLASGARSGESPKRKHV
jgi:hypothetical protein